VTMRRLNGYKVIEIWWLSGIENFVSERSDFILNPFRNFKPPKYDEKLVSLAAGFNEVF